MSDLDVQPFLDELETIERLIDKGRRESNRDIGFGILMEAHSRELRLAASVRPIVERIHSITEELLELFTNEKEQSK